MISLKKSAPSVDVLAMSQHPKTSIHVESGDRSRLFIDDRLSRLPENPNRQAAGIPITQPRCAAPGRDRVDRLLCVGVGLCRAMADH
jgi:hypothetical protein